MTLKLIIIAVAVVANLLTTKTGVILTMIAGVPLTKKEA